MTSENLNVTPDDLAAVQRCKEAYDRIRTELAEVIVGQSDVIEQVLIAIFARGHALLEGVPGLPRRCWSVRWPRPRTWASNASSSRPT